MMTIVYDDWSRTCTTDGTKVSLHVIVIERANGNDEVRTNCGILVVQRKNGAVCPVNALSHVGLNSDSAHRLFARSQVRRQPGCPCKDLLDVTVCPGEKVNSTQPTDKGRGIAFLGIRERTVEGRGETGG